MQLSTLAAILLPALGTVQAGCYSSGVRWNADANQAVSTISTICKSGQIGGFFGAGQTKYFCLNLPNNKKGEFWVQNKGSQGFNLNNDDCILRLNNEVLGCQYGGESVVSGWYFR